jgi:hypothetical protein
MLSFWSLLLAGLAGLVNAKSSSGDSVLVVLESSLPKEDYSIFFRGLEGAFFGVTCVLIGNYNDVQSVDMTLHSARQKT